MTNARLKSILLCAAATPFLIACHVSAAGDHSARRTMVFAGEPRSYRLYAPRARLAKPAILLVLHGLKGSAAEIEARTRYSFDRLADRDGFIVVYPDAIDRQWRSGHPGEAVTSDDVGFLSSLIDSLARVYDVDPKRVYVTGFSNGASMAYRLACERPDRIAAIAPVSGGLAEGLMPACAARSHRPIPLLAIHGTADPVVPFDSGELEGNLAYWVRRNGCATSPTVSLPPDTDPNDGTRTRVERYAHCQGGGDVVLYAIEGGGHRWPGGDEPFFVRPHGRTSRDFDGGTVIWDFLNAHPKP